jgi:hypothetical protein
MLKLNVLAQPEAKGNSYISYTSLDLWWWNYRQFLTSGFLSQTFFCEGINKKKGDCHQWQIMKL